MTHTVTGMTRAQWLFALGTALALIGLGSWLSVIGGHGTALIVLGMLLAGYNSYSYVMARNSRPFNGLLSPGRGA